MDLPQRKNMRLKGYDYSQDGAYFITICVKDRHCLLWENDVGACIARPGLSEIGMIINTAINNIHQIYKTIYIDKYVIMPNHIHMILVLQGDNGRAMRAPTVSTIINQMKGYVSKQIGYSIWQKLFHDHIIRSEEEYQRIWEYIDTNPLKWQDDRYFV